jgi:hypothetical protein
MSPTLGFEPRPVRLVASRHTENFIVLSTNTIHARSVGIYVKFLFEENPKPKALDGVTLNSKMRVSSKTKK